MNWLTTELRHFPQWSSLADCEKVTSVFNTVDSMNQTITVRSAADFLKICEKTFLFEQYHVIQSNVAQDSSISR